MRVYLVRHGQTAWNAERKNQGHTDIPLDEQGQEQARRLVDAFEEKPFSRILTSDLCRAWSTAQPLSERFGVDVVRRPDLRERCFGEWEGAPMERVSQNFLDACEATGLPRDQIRPPAGESTADVWERLTPVVEDILSFSEPQVIVCHGGSGAVLLAMLIRGNLSMVPAIRFDNTGITTLARRADGILQLLSYNDASHLKEPALTGTVDGTIR